MRYTFGRAVLFAWALATAPVHAHREAPVVPVKHRYHRYEGYGEMKAAQATHDKLQALSSGVTAQEVSMTERASTTQFSVKAGRNDNAAVDHDAMLLSARTDMAGTALVHGKRPFWPPPQEEVGAAWKGAVAGVRPGGQSVALTEAMREMPQKATQGRAVVVRELQQERVHAKRTSSGAQRWMARFTGMVAILFLAALAMVLLHHWLSGRVVRMAMGRPGALDLDDVRMAVLRGKEREQAVSSLIADSIISSGGGDYGGGGEIERLPAVYRKLAL